MEVTCWVVIMFALCRGPARQAPHGKATGPQSSRRPRARDRHGGSSGSARQELGAVTSPGSREWFLRCRGCRGMSTTPTTKSSADRRPFARSPRAPNRHFGANYSLVHDRLLSCVGVGAAVLAWLPALLAKSKPCPRCACACACACACGHVETPIRGVGGWARLRAGRREGWGAALPDPTVRDRPRLRKNFGGERERWATEPTTLWQRCFRARQSRIRSRAMLDSRFSIGGRNSKVGEQHQGGHGAQDDPDDPACD